MELCDMGMGRYTTPTAPSCLCPWTRSITSEEMEDSIRECLDAQSGLYLDEIGHALFNQYGVQPHNSTIPRVLERMKITRKWYVNAGVAVVGGRVRSTHTSDVLAVYCEIGALVCSATSISQY